MSQLVQDSFTFDPDNAAADDAVIARDNAALAADSVAAAAADTSSAVAGYRFEDEALAAKSYHGLDVVRHGTRDAVIFWQAANGGRSWTLDTLSLPGREGARLLVVRTCTLDGRADPEVIGLVAIGRDGHRANNRPTRAWRASRVRGRFESLPPRRVRCEDEEDVD